MWLVLVALTPGCAQPPVRPAPPAFVELGDYAAAARPFSGCWAIRPPEPEPDQDLAPLVILELDTLVVSSAGADYPPELRAYGRGGVPRYQRERWLRRMGFSAD
jgi:hypothetical protein